MVRISVIIPVYHVAPYVQRCLESVVTQDMAGSDLECIVVDDCGQDDSMTIVRQLVAAYQGPVHFVLTGHEQNRGLSAARNTGLQAATGDYVLFVDSDDYLLPGSIACFVQHLHRYPSADMLVGNVKNCKDGSLLLHDLQEPWLIGNPEVFARRVLRQQIYLYAWNKLIRRSLLMEREITFLEGILYEDIAWSYSLLHCVNTVVLLPQVTYVYEDNHQSIVNTTLSAGRIDDVIRSYCVTAQVLLDEPVDRGRYRRNMVVDYLLYVGRVLMNASDLLARHDGSSHKGAFGAARRRLMRRTLYGGRLLLASFFLLLYPPLDRLKQWRFFRHHYYDLERLTGRLARLTDFLHRRPLRND